MEKHFLLSVFFIIVFTQVSNSNPVTEFVTTIIFEHFDNCNIIFAHDGYKNNNELLDLTYKILGHFSRNNKEFYVLDLNSSWTLTRYHNIRRRGSHCYLNIISLFLKNIQESISKFSGLITWKYGAPTWKDTDHYVFLSQSGNIDKLLLSKENLNIKFRIAIGASVDPDGNPVIKTACFYCNAGAPRIVQINVRGNLIQKRQTLKYIFPDFLQNFHGYKIRCAVSSKIVYRIEIYLNKHGYWEGKQGPHTNLIQLCQQKMNFTYELFPSNGGGGSGVKWQNGTWTGSMADVLYGNAEFGMVTAQTLQRDELVSFSFPITYDWLTFATGHPKPIHTWKKPFWPFSINLWLCLISTMILVITVLYVLPKLLVKFTFVTPKFYSNQIWFVAGTILEQDIHLPHNLVLRTFVTFWLLFALVVTTAYRSQLVPSLAFPYVEKPPQTFDQLTASSSYRWGLYYLAGAAYAAFRSSTNPTYIKIFKGMELEHSAVKCLVRAIETRFACIIYEGSAVDVVHRSLSDHVGRHPISVAPTTTFFISSCWVMEKRAVFRSNFETIMHLTMDMGLNNHWVARNYDRLREERQKANKSDTTYTLSEDPDGPKALAVEEFTGPFYLFIAGIVLAISAIFIEMLVLKNTPTF